MLTCSFSTTSLGISCKACVCEKVYMYPHCYGICLMLTFISSNPILYLFGFAILRNFFFLVLMIVTSRENE